MKWLALLLCASCTFPSVTFGDADAAPSGDATVDVPVENDSGSDAGTDAAPDPCDEDNDGYRATGACDGGDCNDHDPRVHPGITGWVDDIPDASPWGDWNCDGIIEKEYPNVITTCTTSCGAEGFPASLGCGISGYLVSCVGTVVCSNGDGGFATQGCR